MKVTERQKVYHSSLWRNLRLWKLNENPLCEICLIERKVTGADHIHHLKSFVGIENKVERDKVAYDPDNLMSVCETCHARIHGGDLKGCISKEDIRKRIML